MHLRATRVAFSRTSSPRATSFAAAPSIDRRQSGPKHQPPVGPAVLPLKNDGQTRLASVLRVPGGLEMPPGTAQLARSLRPNALVRVTLPSADRSRRALAVHRFHRRVERTLLAIASGATTYRGFGAWRNGGTRPVRERVLIVESFLPARLTASDRRQIIQCLCEVARDARQEALLVAVDGRPFFLRPGLGANGALS